MVNPSFTLQAPQASIPGAIAVSSSIQILVDNRIIFNVISGSIEIITLYAECQSLNNSNTAQARWRSNPSVGDEVVISGFTTLLSNFAAKTSFVLDPVTLTTVPIMNLAPTGVSLGGEKTGVIVPVGSIQINMSGGLGTSGTWKHFMSYRPLSENSVVEGV